MDVQVESARWEERGGVQTYFPAVLLGFHYPAQRMLHSGEVGLRRVDEETPVASVAVCLVAQEFVEVVAVETELLLRYWRQKRLPSRSERRLNDLKEKQQWQSEAQKWQ